MKFQAIFARFWKGFLAGAITSVVAMLQGGYTVNSVEDLKKLGIALVGAFISGGFLASWKYLTWVE